MRLVKSALYLLCESRINLSSRGAHLDAAGVRVRLVAANRLPRKSVNSRQCTGAVVRPPTRFAPWRGRVVGAIASGGWLSMCVVQYVQSCSRLTRMPFGAVARNQKRTTAQSRSGFIFGPSQPLFVQSFLPACQSLRSLLKFCVSIAFAFNCAADHAVRKNIVDNSRRAAMSRRPN